MAKSRVQNDSETYNDGMEYLSSSSNAMGVWHTLEAMVGQNMRRNLNYEGYNNDPNSNNQFKVFTAIRRNDSLSEHFQSAQNGRKASRVEMANRESANVSGSAKIKVNDTKESSSVKKNVNLQAKRRKSCVKGGKKLYRDKFEDLGVDCR